MGIRTCYPKIWHLGMLNILKLKEFEKKAETRMSLWPSPHPSSLKYVMRASCERCPPYTQRKGASLSIKTKAVEKNFNKQALLSFPSLLHLPHTLWSIIFLHNCPLFIKPSKKILRSFPLGFHFLMKASVLCKTLFYFCFLATPHGLQELNSPTRDWICAPCSGNSES